MKWRSLVLALSIVASTSFAQSTSYNGEWQGKYSCGPALHRTGPGTAAFSVNVTLRVNGTKAAMVREDAAAREVTEGMVTADGALGLQGTGRLTAANSTPWRTRFEGKFQGSAFSATGVIDSTNGATKFRECTLALQRSSPAKAAAQIQPPAATDRPPTVAAVPKSPASTSTAPESKPTTGRTGSAGKVSQVTIPATGVKTPDVIAVPPLSARVTDLTNTLSSSQRQSLEAALAAFEKKNSSQIAVLMLPSTQPETIEQYSMRVADRWRIGRAKVDDGVILVIAKNDQHLRIEVGSGLEGAIPNMKAKRIIREVIAPRLKEGDFFGGIRDGSNELMSLVESASLATGGERVGRQSTKAKASPTVPAATQAQSTVTTPSQAPTQSTDLRGPESKGKDLAAVEALATPPVTSTQPVEPANKAPLPKSERTAGSVPKPENIESIPSAAGERAPSNSFDRKALLMAALAGAGIVGLVVFVVARLRRRSTITPSEKHLAQDKSAVPPVYDAQSGLADRETGPTKDARSFAPIGAGAVPMDVHLTEQASSPTDVELRDEKTIALAEDHPAGKAAQMGIKYRLVSRGFKEGVSEGEAKEHLGKLFSLPTDSVEAMFSNSERVMESGLALDDAVRLQKALDTAGVICVVEPDQRFSELPSLPPSHQEVRLPAASAEKDFPPPRIGQRQSLLAESESNAKGSEEAKEGDKTPLWQKLLLGTIFALGGASVLFKGANKVSDVIGESRITSSAQQLVKDSLRSPASFVPVSTEIVWKGRFKDRDAYIVKTQYDAQNAFGATLRGCNYVAFSLQGDQIHWNKSFFLEACFRGEGTSGLTEAQLVDTVRMFNFE